MIQKQYETASQCTRRRAYYKRVSEHLAVMSSHVVAACSVSRCLSTASPQRPSSTAQLCRSVESDWREFHYKVVAVRYSRSKIALLAEFNSRKQQVLGFLHTLTILSEKCGP